MRLDQCFVCFWRNISGQKWKTRAHILLESRPGRLQYSGTWGFVRVTLVFLFQLLVEMVLPGAKDDLVIDLFGACASSVNYLRERKRYNIRR